MPQKGKDSISTTTEITTKEDVLQIIFADTRTIIQKIETKR
jgi:hypothetical protein